MLHNQSLPNFAVMKKVIAGLFFVFICGVIYLANTSQLDQAYAYIGVDHLVKLLPVKDKFGHFFLYGFLAFLFNMGLNYKSFSWKENTFQLGALLVLSFAIIEEFTQLAIPAREFDFVDILADVLGIFLFSKFSLQVKNWRIKAMRKVPS